MLQTLLSVLLTAASIGEEPMNPADIMAAMASRDTGCITGTDVFLVQLADAAHPVPHPLRPVERCRAAMDRGVTGAESGSPRENYFHPHHHALRTVS